MHVDVCHPHVSPCQQTHRRLHWDMAQCDSELNRRETPKNKHTNCTSRFVNSRERGVSSRDPCCPEPCAFTEKKAALKAPFYLLLALHPKAQSYMQKQGQHAPHSMQALPVKIRYCNFLSKRWRKVQVRYEKRK